MTTTETPVDNGVNVEALLGVREALGDTPEIAQFQWRSTVSWVNGTHSRSDVETFYGFGGEQQHRTTFSYDVDHPLQFAAQDKGVTPVEVVLVALGGCLTAGVAAVAQQRSIQLRSVRATLAAEMDPTIHRAALLLAPSADHPIGRAGADDGGVRRQVGDRLGQVVGSLAVLRSAEQRDEIGRPLQLRAAHPPRLLESCRRVGELGERAAGVQRQCRTRRTV